MNSILGAKPPKILEIHDKFVSKNESDNKETVEIKGPLYRFGAPSEIKGPLQRLRRPFRDLVDPFRDWGVLQRFRGSFGNLGPLQ